MIQWSRDQQILQVWILNFLKRGFERKKGWKFCYRTLPIPCWHNNDGIMLLKNEAVLYKIKLRTNLLLSLLFKMSIFHVFSVYIWWMMQCLSSSKYKYYLNKTHQIKFNVWFHSWLCIFRIIHNRPKFYFDLYCFVNAKMLKSSIFHTITSESCS